MVDGDRRPATLQYQPPPGGLHPEFRATDKPGEPVDASPAAAGRTLFLRAAGHLYAIEATGP